MADEPGFFDYVKTAFLNHWNLLAFGAATLAGIFSGHPDVVLPLVAAGEVAYLAGLSRHPKFQSYVKAQAHKQKKYQVKKENLERIFASLDPRSRARFEELRRRFQNLQAMARGLSTADMGEVQNLHHEGINRLLWVFLKLLYSKRSMERFLSTTTEAQIRDSVKEVERKLEQLGPPAEDTPAETKMRHTLESTKTSTEARLENYLRAQENYQFIQLELDRIDAKITSIAEMAVNRQEPDFITSEVDGVAATMEQTEAAMSELQFISGLESTDAAPPAFIDEDLDLEKS
jgi:hypothetical protein